MGKEGFRGVGVRVREVWEAMGRNGGIECEKRRKNGNRG